MSSQIRIRRAVEADRISLFKLCILMHPETDYRNYAIDPEKILESLRGWIENGIVLVAERDDAIIGLMLGTVTEPWFSSEVVAREDFLYVLPSFRGGRAAYLLVRTFLEMVKESGIRHVQAGVSTGAGAGAERLYEHFGLTRMGSNFSAHY